MDEISYQDLRKHCYFSGLSDEALEAILKKMHVVKIPAGTEIIKENTPADAFYIIRNGEVEVLKKTKWGQTAKINILGHGKGFGEMALLTCSPRCCAVTAKTNVTLLKLYKINFEEIVRDAALSNMIKNQTQSYSKFNRLKTLQPFALLEREKMVALIDKLVEKKYAAGEKMITQGEKGDVYYIIKSGRVAVLKKMLKDEAEHVATIEEGHGFGEEALITNSPRNATVQTLDETVVLTLSKSDFSSILKSSFLEEVYPEDILSDTKGQHNYIDVRMKMEFDEEHLQGAINIPLDELRMRYSELNQSKEYYVYCLVGQRSATAAFLMNSQGLKARSIRGGLNAWTGPVVQGNNDVENIRNGVRDAYSSAADNPSKKYRFPVGRWYAESIGYNKEILDILPDVAIERFAGVSNVSIFAEIPAGATVLDVGCGGGLDCLISAQKTGPKGKVIGVDFSDSMIKRAHIAAGETGYDNVEFLCTDAENLPFDSASFDIVLVNGIFNLNPERDKIFKEISRVLRSEGTLYAAELILTENPQDKEMICELNDWSS